VLVRSLLEHYPAYRPAHSSHAFQRACAGAGRPHAGPLRVRAPAPRLNPTSLPGLNQALELDLQFGRAADSIDDVRGSAGTSPFCVPRGFSDFLRRPRGARQAAEFYA
jgi:hypothetical protein